MGLFALLILLGYSIYPVLAAVPDLVVRLSPVAATEEDDSGIEFLAKRAQFGTRDRLLEGRLVRPPGYDFFLCERFQRTIEVNEDGQVSVVALPPFQKPEDSTVMLVPRGECTFERKAFAAKHFYGAKAILIYDRLGARYTWNETSQSVNFPQAKWDYECANGNSMLYDLPLDPPAYDETQLDPIMGYTTEMPRNPATSFPMAEEGSGVGSSIGLTTKCDLTNTALNPCESQLCLVTSHLENSTNYPVCCAWDNPITMPKADDAKDLNTDDILAVWLTIRQAELIFQSDLLSSDSAVSIKGRGSSTAFNVTYIFMWIWGTLVMLAGALYSAGDYRRFNAKLTEYKANGGDNRESGRINNVQNRAPRRKTGGRNDQAIGNSSGSSARIKKGKFINEELNRDLESGKQSLPVEMDGDSKINGKNSQERRQKKQSVKGKKGDERDSKHNNGGWSLHSLPPPERKRKETKPLRKKKPRENSNSMNQPNTEEENGTRSSTLVPARESRGFSPFEFSQWHAIALVVMASLTLVLLYFFPRLYTIIFVLWALGCAGATSYLIISPLINTAIPKFGDDWVEEFNKPVICGCNGFNITCNLITYIWAFVWIWFGLTNYRPQMHAFFWITLNIFGACVCVLSVTLLKLNSIKIATFLMIAIFIYDVFFVFITPFLTGGVSVMLQVAAGSDDPTAAEICLRYPDDCKGIGFLPMLFILPKVNDFARGTVILGLGDIFWPGFLVAFCARHDEAARLLGAHTGFPDIKSPSKWYEGYLFPMMVAYSLGLFIAFLAVILSGQGQPALLYIVPVCLTTIFILGRHDIKDLWNGSKVFKLADGLVSKTERSWGKARMKEFAERVQRQNADNESGPERHSAKRSAENPSERLLPNATASNVPNDTQPKPKDICFGYDDHPGTKYFRRIVQEVAIEYGEEEFKPEIHKLIRKRLKGRRFFMKNNVAWAEASKLDTRKQIGRAYDRVRGARSSVLRDSDPLSRRSIT